MRKYTGYETTSIRIILERRWSREGVWGSIALRGTSDTDGNYSPPPSLSPAPCSHVSTPLFSSERDKSRSGLIEEPWYSNADRLRRSSSLHLVHCRRWKVLPSCESTIGRAVALFSIADGVCTVHIFSVRNGTSNLVESNLLGDSLSALSVLCSALVVKDLVDLRETSSTIILRSGLKRRLASSRERPRSYFRRKRSAGEFYGTHGRPTHLGKNDDRVDDAEYTE